MCLIASIVGKEDRRYQQQPRYYANHRARWVLRAGLPPSFIPILFNERPVLVRILSMCFITSIVGKEDRRFACSRTWRSISRLV
jgi:hypothetical protein